MLTKAEGEQKEHHEARASEVAVASLKGMKALVGDFPRVDKTEAPQNKKGD